MGCSLGDDCSSCTFGGLFECADWESNEVATYNYDEDDDFDYDNPEDEDDYERVEDVDTGDEQYCISCGALVQHDWNYCVKCGVAIQKQYCAKCSREVAVDWEYCPQCGSSIPDGTAQNEDEESPSISCSALPPLNASSSIYDEDIPF